MLNWCSSQKYFNDMKYDINNINDVKRIPKLIYTKAFLI